MDSRTHKTAYQYFIKENGKKVEITKDQVDSITLDNGTGILDIHGDSTIINNYLGIFWKSIIGARNFSILHSLVMHTFGDKNQSWLSRNTIAEENGIKDKKTVDKAMEELEEFGFVKIVNVFNAETNTNESNTYIVRRTTPFISVKQYEKFSTAMKERHDQFIQKLITSGRANVSVVPDYRNGIEMPSGNNLPSGNFPLPINNPLDVENGLSENSTFGIEGNSYPSGNFPLHENSIAPSGNFPSTLEEKSHTNKNEFNKNELQELNKITMSIEYVNALLHNELKSRLSKQSFDTWIKPCLLTQMTNGDLYYKTPNEFCKDWVEQRYKKLIVEILSSNGVYCQRLIVFS